MRVTARACRLGLAMALAGRLAAQDASAVRIVEGRIRRPGEGNAPPRAIAGQWVVLHRVGSDQAGPVDSTRTDGVGAYRFRYRATGRTDAVYFVSSSYAGIAYISPPLRGDVVRGNDADVLVFDTTSTGLRLRLEGRHFVLGAPDPDGGRKVADIFDLSNDSSRTLVSRDASTPLWTARLPTYALEPAVNEGDIPPAAVTFLDGAVNLFAPVSPGVRQLAITYRLPPRAFPLSLPMEGTVSVLEVLTEESRARAAMERLQQTASVSTQGRNFARYLAQDVPANSVLRIDVPSALLASTNGFVWLTMIAMAVTMVVVLGFVLWRGSPSARRVAERAPADSARHLHALAQLDAAFDREAAPSPARSVEHARARDALKRRILDALAVERIAP